MTNIPASSGLSMMAAAPLTSNKSSRTDEGGTWFEALSEAWGKTLDGEAAKIEQMSAGIGDGADNPSAITKLTAETMRMSFLANSSSSSIDSVGKALETMARKG